MKKLIILALLAVIMAGCFTHNPKDEVQTYIITKINGDTLSLKSQGWHWDGSHNVVFESYKGNQYISDVKDIIIK